MKRYAIRCGTLEVKYKERNRIKPGCFWSFDEECMDTDLIEVTESKEMGLALLDKYRLDVRVFPSYFLVHDYFLVEEDVNEDGNIEDDEIIEFAKSPFYGFLPHTYYVGTGQSQETFVADDLDTAKIIVEDMLENSECITFPVTLMCEGEKISSYDVNEKWTDSF